MDGAQKQIDELEKETMVEGFWDDLEKSQKILKKSKALKNKVESYESLKNDYDDTLTMIEMAIEEDDDSVYAELMPEDKVQLLEEFCNDRMENEKLAFVGDGMNDAPVLALADIGIAMGGLGADAALEAADIILMEDEPSKIINAVRIAKGTIRSVRENVLFAIGMKVFLVILAFFGLVTMQSAIIADMVVMVINILNSFWMMKYPESGV